MKIDTNKLFEGMDEELKLPQGVSLIKKGKFRLIIIYEDNSYNEYFRKIKDAYTFTIKNRKYFIMSESILKGKNSTLVYYFNNPFPLKFKFQMTKALTTPDVNVDALVLNNAFNSNLLSKMYAPAFLTPKNIIIILVAVTIVTLIFLQVFGVVDVMGMISGSSAGG